MQNPLKFSYVEHKAANGKQVLEIHIEGTDKVFNLPYVIKGKDLPDEFKRPDGFGIMVQEPSYRRSCGAHIARTGYNHMTPDGKDYIRWSDFQDANLKPKAFEDNTAKGELASQELIEFMYDKLPPALLQPLDDFLASL